MGVLLDMGETLQDFSGDEDLRLGLGPALPKSLSRVTDHLLDLLRRYFAPALVRMGPLNELTLTEGDDPRAVLRQIGENLERLKRNDGSKVPPLAPDDIAVIERLVDEVRRAGRNFEAASDPQVKEELGNEFAKKSAQVSIDKVLYVYRALQLAVGGKDDNVADAMLRRFALGHTITDIVMLAWEILKAIL